jgi:hypothetical protein
MIQFKIVSVLQNEPNLFSYLQMPVFGARLYPSSVARPRRPQIGPVFVTFNVLGVRCALDEHHATNWVRFGKNANQAQAGSRRRPGEVLRCKFLRSIDCWFAFLPKRTQFMGEGGGVGPL